MPAPISRKTLAELVALAADDQTLVYVDDVDAFYELEISSGQAIDGSVIVDGTKNGASARWERRNDPTGASGGGGAGGPGENEFWVDSVAGDAAGTGGIFDTIANAITTGIGGETPSANSKWAILVFSALDASSFTVPKFVSIIATGTLKTVLTGTITTGSAIAGFDDFSNIPLMGGFVIDGGTLQNTGGFALCRDMSFRNSAQVIQNAAGGLLSIFRSNGFNSTFTQTDGQMQIATCGISNCALSMAGSKFQLQDSTTQQCTLTGAGLLEVVGGTLQQCTTATGETLDIEANNVYMDVNTFDHQPGAGVVLNGGTVNAMTLDTNFNGAVTYNNVAQENAGADNGLGARTFAAEAVAI